MVDVSRKEPGERRARARARIRLSTDAFAALQAGTLKKGDALGVARIAGIMAAKRTGDIIPLCHPLAISAIDVSFELDQVNCSVMVATEVAVNARTGVEMEALTAAAVSALAIYDMCKAVDKGIVIEEVALVSKEGGKSGAWSAENRVP